MEKGGLPRDGWLYGELNPALIRDRDISFPIDDRAIVAGYTCKSYESDRAYP